MTKRHELKQLTLFSPFLLVSHIQVYYVCVLTTLNMIFNVTYYLELHNAIFICCISHILPTNVKLVVWTL